MRQLRVGGAGCVLPDRGPGECLGQGSFSTTNFLCVICIRTHLPVLLFLNLPFSDQNLAIPFFHSLCTVDQYSSFVPVTSEFSRCDKREARSDRTKIVV